MILPLAEWKQAWCGGNVSSVHNEHIVLWRPQSRHGLKMRIVSTGLLCPCAVHNQCYDQNGRAGDCRNSRWWGEKRQQPRNKHAITARALFMCRVITFSAFVAMGSPPCWSGSFLHKQMTLMCRCELVGTSSWEQVKRQAQLEEAKQTGKGRTNNQALFVPKAIIKARKNTM